MTEYKFAKMHSLLAEYHPKIADQVLLNVVQQYHTGSRSGLGRPRRYRGAPLI
jgi:hypothetical protein